MIATVVSVSCSHRRKWVKAPQNRRKKSPSKRCPAHAPEEFQIAAYEWWSKHQGKDATDLGLLYLETGGGSQKQIAIKQLLETDEPRAFSAIEKHILASSSPVRSLDLAQRYLRIRRAKGKPFYEQYLKLLDAESEGYAEDYGEEYAADQRKRIEVSKKKLDLLINEVSPEKIMSEISSGKRSVKEGFPLLKVALGENNTTAKLDLLLIFINSLENPGDRLEALQALANWANSERENDSEGEGEARESSEKLARKHQEHWAPFLARRDPLSIDSEVLSTFSNPPSEAHYAASIINNIHFSDSTYDLRELYQVATVAEVWPIILARIDAFFESGNATPIPSAEQVSEKRRDEILAEVKKRPAREVIPYRETLDFAERLALMAEIGKLKTLPENLANLANICQKIDWSYCPDFTAAEREKVEAQILNKEISFELIQSLADHLSAQEADQIIYLMGNPGSISGPRIMFGAKDIVQSWASNFIEEEISRLDGQKLTRLTALVAFGSDEENPRSPKVAALFKGSSEAAEEKAAFHALAKEGVALFEPSASEDRLNTSRSQFGFAIVTTLYQEDHESEDE